jgi:hypothetical protein
LTSALQNIHHYFQPKQPEDLYEYCVKLFRAHNFHSSIKPCKCIANATLGVLLMKTATIPFLRVDPALREAAEKVLQYGETLSGFVEQSVRAQIAQRQAQQEFVARGLIARDAARQSGVYVPAKTVIAGSAI